MTSTKENSVAIIGAGLFGLVTAKVFLHDSDAAFSSVTIFEKQSSLGGVWAKDRIYPGLASNSPVLTYEIPGFQYPEHLRKCGAHVQADDINSYLHTFAETYDLTSHIHFNTLVQDVSWDEVRQTWCIVCRGPGGKFKNYCKFLVVCNGMYHEKNIPNIAMQQDHASSIPKMFHSSDVGSAGVRQTLSSGKHTLVIGAGKSAIDLATMIARGDWLTNRESAPAVTLLYKRPHWLSPRSILMGLIYFERILFSRFLNAWLPFATHANSLHSWIAESAMGKWLTNLIFCCVEQDFKVSLGQRDLPETIPNHSLKEALSGALHVVPQGYLDFVRQGKIRIVQGSVKSVSESGADVQTNGGFTLSLKVNSILWATGYKLAFPFFSLKTLQQLGLAPNSTSCDPEDLPYLKLYRLLVPPKTAHVRPNSAPYRNIAFNGFAYSLLNPTVSFISAHWIAEYFSGTLSLPNTKAIEGGEIDVLCRSPVLRALRVEHCILPVSLLDNDVIGADRERVDVERFYEWQSRTFAKHGAKGVHIGPHATLHTDQLLRDMKVATGHVGGWKTNAVKFAQEWFRPMYPQIYKSLGGDRRARNERQQSASSEKQHQPLWKTIWLTPGLGLFVSLWLPLIAALVQTMIRAK